jgi:hypothetical protein
MGGRASTKGGVLARPEAIDPVRSNGRVDMVAWIGVKLPGQPQSCEVKRPCQASTVNRANCPRPRWMSVA